MTPTRPLIAMFTEVIRPLLPFGWTAWVRRPKFCSGKSDQTTTGGLFDLYLKLIKDKLPFSIFSNAKYEISHFARFTLLKC